MKKIKLILIMGLLFIIGSPKIMAANLNVEIEPSTLSPGSKFNIIVTSDKSITDYELTVTGDLPEPSIKEMLPDAKKYLREKESIIVLFQLAAQKDKTPYTKKVLGNFEYTLPENETDGEKTITINLEATDKDGQNFSEKVVKKITVKKETVTDKPKLQLKELSINGSKIALKDNVYEYEFKVSSKTNEVDIKATLDSDKLSFVKDFGPRKVTKLKTGKNEVLIKIKDQANNEKTYKLTIEKEKANPLTGMIIPIGILIGGATLVITLNIVAKKKRKFYKI